MDNETNSTMVPGMLGDTRAVYRAINPQPVQHAHRSDVGVGRPALRTWPGGRIAWWGVAGAYGAAAWGLGFALVHLYWVLGGRVGLPTGMSLSGNTPLLVIDVIAIPLCVIAAALALALVRRWGRRLPRRLLLSGAWATAALLTVHALPSVLDWAALVLGVRSSGDLDATARFATFLYEPIFLLGGILFGLAVLGHQRTR